LHCVIILLHCFIASWLQSTEVKEEEILARHQDLTRKRAALSAELDSQLQLSKNLRDQLDQRVGRLGAKLAVIEATAQSAGSGCDDQLTEIETRNNQLKLSSQSLIEQQQQRNSVSLFLQKKQRRQKQGGAVGRPRSSGAGPTAAQLKKQRQQEELSLQYSAGLTGGAPADPNEPLYCLCRNVFFGEMVGCDDPDCEVEWFHFGCVGLLEAPEQWFCPDCTEKRAAGRGKMGRPKSGAVRGAKGAGKAKGKGAGKRGRPRKVRSDDESEESEESFDSGEEF
jgi:hypothetical protein